MTAFAIRRSCILMSIFPPASLTASCYTHILASGVLTAYIDCTYTLLHLLPSSHHLIIFNINMGSLARPRRPRALCLASSLLTFPNPLFCLRSFTSLFHSHLQFPHPLRPLLHRPPHFHHPQLLPFHQPLQILAPSPLQIDSIALLLR